MLPTPAPTSRNDQLACTAIPPDTLQPYGRIPIGVKDAPEAAGEYAGYRAGVMQLLRSGASGEAIAEHLSSVEQERMGFGRPLNSCDQSGEGIVRWYADSLARWDAAHPLR
jgi:hypothetical protein